MKALTIKQPWASLIVNNYKKYEFRTWKTNYRGKVLIHAGKTIGNKDIYNKYDLEYLKGAIIGEAYITDCIQINSTFKKKLLEENEELYRNANLNEYAWKLDKIKKYENPIYINGKLGLWNFKKML